MKNGDRPDNPGHDSSLLSLFTQGPVVVLVWKPLEGWPLAYVSPNCEPLFGYNDNRMTQPDFLYTRCVHPDDLDGVDREVRQYLNENRDSWEHRYRIVRSDGEVRWVYDFSRPQRDAQGALLAIHGYLLDQTSHVLSEQALRESELRWQFAIEGAGDGLWDWNAKTNKVFFSRQWKAMLGYEEHEIGDSLDEWDSRLHPEDKDQCYHDLNRHFRGETDHYLNEHRVRCKDGSYKWILDRGKAIKWDMAGAPLRVIGTHTDISSRKQAEAALRKAETRYRTLLEFLPDGVLLIDPETALPLEFNTAAHQQLGYSREEFAALRIQDYEALEDPEETAAHIKKLFQSGREDFETSHRRKDGSLMHVMVTVMIVELDDEGPILLTVFRDITDKKKAEEALTQSERRFREFAENVDVAFWVRTPQAMEYVSPGYEKIWGRSVTSLYENPDSFLQSVHPDDVSRVHEAMRHNFKKDGVFDEQYRIVLPDGAIRWVHAKSFLLNDEHPASLRSTGVAHDITDRKHAEEALRYSEQRFKDVARAAGEYIWETDVNGDYVYLTDRGAVLLGRPLRELVGSSPFRFMPQEDASRVQAFFLEKAGAKQSFAGLEHRSIRPDGEIIWQRVSGLPMFDDQGRLAGYRGVGLDITDAKLAEEELRLAKDDLEVRVQERTAELQHTLEELHQAKEQAESASRMKTDFLMNVSHELLTPLNAVKGMLELMDDAGLDQEQLACLDEVRQAAKRLLRIVDDVLVVTRLDKYTPQLATVDLTSLLQGVVNTLRPKAEEKRIELTFQRDPDCPPVVRSDMHLLQLILHKLGDNALKFTRHDSVQPSVKLEVACRQTGVDALELCFTVTDSGVGMAPEKIQELLGGMLQEDAPLTRRFAGLGLGLQTVRKALHLLNGTMDVTSEPDNGSRFQVCIPSESCDIDNLDACLLKD